MGGENWIAVDTPKSLLDAVAMPGSDDIVFDPPGMGAGLFRVPDLT